MKAGVKDGLKDVLLEWLQQTQPDNIPNDGHILRGKATEVAVALNIPGFRASNGWLHHFKQRHNIRYRIRGCIKKFPDWTYRLECMYLI